jgi:hypothetical protein
MRGARSGPLKTGIGYPKNPGIVKETVAAEGDRCRMKAVGAWNA